MADIDVERKRGAGWLWWLLGLVVLALIIWAIVEAIDDQPDTAPVVEPTPVVSPSTEPTTPGVADTVGLPAPVQGYLASCTEEFGAPEGEMGLQHQFTVRCLQQLREGLNTIVVLDTVGGVDVQQQLDQYTDAVQQLQQSDPQAVTHANTTRDAAMSAVTLLEGMRDAYFPARPEVDRAVAEAQEAAESIRTDVPMLQQRESVHNFLREAGDALRIASREFATRPL